MIIKTAVTRLSLVLTRVLHLLVEMLMYPKTAAGWRMGCIVLNSKMWFYLKTAAKTFSINFFLCLKKINSKKKFDERSAWLVLGPGLLLLKSDYFHTLAFTVILKHARKSVLTQWLQKYCLLSSQLNCSC